MTDKRTPSNWVNTLLAHSLWVAVGAVIGAAVGHLQLASQSHPNLPIVIGALWGAILGDHARWRYKYRRALALMRLELRSAHPNASNQIKKIARPAQHELQKSYDRTHALLMRLLLDGSVDNAQYRDQFALARLLYPLHSSRFWATSLDLWSAFLRANEDYSFTMKEVAKSLPTARLDPVPGFPKGDPPPRARIFILPADLFVKDVVFDPIAARYLVLHHIDYGIDARIIIVATEDEAAQEAIASLPSGETKIADYMLVDNAFVYGRVATFCFSQYIPESEPMPSSDSGLMLRLLTDASAIEDYERQFGAIWEQAISLEDFADEASVWTSKEVSSKSAQLAIESVGRYRDSDKRIFGNVFTNICLDIDNKINAPDRDKRYVGFTSTKSKWKSFGWWFLEQLSASNKVCLAIDQADIKNRAGLRFWQTWEKDGYKDWRQAFHHEGQLKCRRRIFVLRDWMRPDDESFQAFLMTELKFGVELGFVLEKDLESFSANISESDKAVFDAEWMIVGLDGMLNKPAVTMETIGMNFAEKTFTLIDNVDFEKHSLTRRKIESHLEWHRRLWNSEDAGLYRVTCFNEAREFDSFLKTQVASLV